MRKRLLLCLLCVLALTLCACAKKPETTEVVIVPKQEETAPPESTPTPEEVLRSLAGDWYGWWHIRHATGDWAGKYGYFWDCCAEIGEDGTMLLWDETLPKDNFLAETMILYGPDGFSCRGGSMLDKELEPENWELLATEDKAGKLLTIRGRYEAVMSEGAFSYEIFLRPWGSEWPGSENEVPYYYEDWYLPLIRAGEEMPDTIGP